MPLVTKDWSVHQFKRGESAHDEFYVSDAADAEVARSLVGIAKGQSHYLDDRLKASMPDVNAGAAPRQFRVSVDYAPLQPVAPEEEEETPPRYKATPQKTQVPVDRDRSGNPIVNSARDAFDQPNQKTITDYTYEYRRKETRFNIDIPAAFNDSVNSDRVFLPGFGACDPGTLLFDVYTTEADMTRNDKAVSSIYRLLWRKDGWKTRNLDQGFRCFVANSGTISTVQIVDTGGNPASVPVRLNGSGQPVDISVWRAGDAKTVPNAAKSPPEGAEVETTADASFLKYKLYNERPFAQLHLTA